MTYYEVSYSMDLQDSNAKWLGQGLALALLLLSCCKFER